MVICRPFILFCLCLLLCSCGRSDSIKTALGQTVLEDTGASEKAGTAPGSGETTGLPRKSARADLQIITLPHDEPDFPPAPGRETFIRSCIVCHSLRYISMQPDFSEETWRKEVEKMKNTWGAHITDAEVNEIVAYLMQVKGKGRPKLSRMSGDNKGANEIDVGV